MVLAFERNEAGDVDGAILDCREALEFAPDSTSAHSLMGMLYEKKGERDKAITEFEKVLELNPGSIAVREKLTVAQTLSNASVVSSWGTRPIMERAARKSV